MASADTKKELAQVHVDMTVQKKNITHPTDSKLYLRAIFKLADATQDRGVKLRKTYCRVANAFVDKGYRGHDYKAGAKIHLAGSSTRHCHELSSKEINVAAPKISHLETDNCMSRCFLKGLAGDSSNAVLAAAGSNLVKLLCEIAHSLIFWLWNRLRQQSHTPEQSLPPDSCRHLKIKTAQYHYCQKRTPLT